MMLTIQVEKIVGCVSPCPCVTLTVAAAYCAVSCIVSSTYITRQRLVEILNMLNTNIALQGKTLDRHNVDITITKDTPRRVLVVAHVVKCLYRVVDI